MQKYKINKVFLFCRLIQVLFQGKMYPFLVNYHVNFLLRKAGESEDLLKNICLDC